MENLGVEVEVAATWNGLSSVICKRRKEEAVVGEEVGGSEGPTGGENGRDLPGFGSV